MKSIPRQAMVLAAGRGERMRPLTAKKPKPLIEVMGRSMLDRVFDRLHAVGVRDAVVNLHHLGDQIKAHLKQRDDMKIAFSDEEELLLETGGGVAKAQSLLGKQPFYVINGDVVWLDGGTPALQRLAEAWDAKQMDILLLLHPVTVAHGYDGQGDFFMDPAGRLRRREEREIAPFIFAGIQILHPRVLKDLPEGAFSLNLLYDRAIEAERLWGLRHDGEWFHVGTPESLSDTEDKLHHMSLGAVQK